MTPPKKFTVSPLEIPDVLLVSVERFEDGRGWFSENYNNRDMSGIFGVVFVQENEAYSRKVGTLRGLHFQSPPHAQAKLVHVVQGAIYDVAVDLRSGSPTYGRWCAQMLDHKSALRMFIPVGFAHGYCTLAPDTRVIYKVSDYYSPECEGGILWNDPDLAINWPVISDPLLLRAKDLNLPRLAEFETPF